MAPLLTGLQRFGVPVVHWLCFPTNTYVIPISSPAVSQGSGTCGASPLDLPLPLPLPAWALLALGQLRREDGSPHALSEENTNFRCRFDHVSARGCVKVMPTQDKIEATTRFATWKARITDRLPSINMLGIVQYLTRTFPLRRWFAHPEILHRTRTLDCGLVQSWALGRTRG